MPVSAPDPAARSRPGPAPTQSAAQTLAVHPSLCMQVAQPHKTTAPLTFTYDQARNPAASMRALSTSVYVSASQTGQMCSQAHTASLRLLCLPGIPWVITLHLQVFGAASPQSDVFAEVGLPLCRAVLDGFDGELVKLASPQSRPPPSRLLCCCWHPPSTRSCLRMV